MRVDGVASARSFMKASSSLQCLHGI